MLVDFRPDIKKLEKNTKKKVKKTANSFLSALFGAESKEFESTIEKLLQEVDDSGEELKKDRNFLAFEKYKKNIKKLVDKLIEQNNIIKKTTGKTTLGGRQLYTIKSINLELEEMARKLIDNKDIHYVLNKMDDVRGMLVDVYSE
ncbi:MAG: YaaR family protein [Candidatus Muirbacterium halophilum]|nr:YaaR family protein [Candidatus Muirbacterium halophilum]MCK9474798.1 YaaR family protein [Candidatus Muirbacterium halophilum]